MAETTYNFTISHTSPLMWYENFSTECPDKESNGFPVCDDTKGFHLATNTTTARMQLNFFGSAMYLYGSADEGMEYVWSLDSGPKTTGKPNGNILIAAENLKPGPYDTSFRLEVVLTQFKSGARFQVNKADVIFGTGMTGAQTFVDSYKPENNSVRLMAGWVANDTIPGYHYYQSDSFDPLKAFLNFQGAAVWVWGFCGRRVRSPNIYGAATVDDGYTYDISIHPNRVDVVDHKCLLHWQSGLDVTQPHNITYNSKSALVLLESFEVLRVEGGTRISTTESSPSSTRTLSPTSDSSLTNSNPTGAIIGGVVGGLALLCAVVLMIVLIRRRQSRQQKVLPAVVALEPKFTSATSLPPSQSSKF